MVYYSTFFLYPGQFVDILLEHMSYLEHFAVKGSFALCPASRFNRHLLGYSRQIWGNARLVLHRAFRKLTVTILPLNYAKETPLLPYL